MQVGAFPFSWSVILLTLKTFLACMNARTVISLQFFHSPCHSTELVVLHIHPHSYLILSTFDSIRFRTPHSLDADNMAGPFVSHYTPPDRTPVPTLIGTDPQGEIKVIPVPGGNKTPAVIEQCLFPARSFKPQSHNHSRTPCPQELTIDVPAACCRDNVSLDLTKCGKNC